MLRVIKDLFSSNPACVLVNNLLSPKFLINHGVLQGSKLGPILFNVFINDLLNELDKTGSGATIGAIHIAALGFADDIVLISDDPQKLQDLLNLCQSWSIKNEMTFNTSKCKVMIFNGPAKNSIFTLCGKALEIVNSHKYLGVILSSKYVTNLFRSHFTSILERARIKVALIRRHGFHDDGLRLKTAINMYKLIIRPLLEYCAQSLSYGRYSHPAHLDAPTDFAKELEQFQTQTLKTLINCPRSTSPAVVRLFCGVEPLTCRLEILKLRYFWRTLHCPKDTTPNRILTYRKKKFLDFNKGFAHEAFNICCKYNLMHLWHGKAASLKPLHEIKKVIISKNLQNDLDASRSKSCSFISLFLTNAFSYQKKYHLVEPFLQPNCFDLPNGRKRFIKALLHPCSYLEECVFCREQYKDKLKHLLTACPLTSGKRKELLLKLSLYNFPRQQFPLEKDKLLNAALTSRIWRKCFTKFLIDTDF